MVKEALTPKVLAVCTSEAKGERKRPVREAELRREGGVASDAHGDDPMRQISLLADESAERVRASLPDIGAGDFAENILTEGVVLHELPVGTRIGIGGAEGVTLEITQIGKECHEGCRIKQLTGDCVMPREGVFAKVVREGKIRPGDGIRVMPAYTAAVLTVSDKASRGEREDTGGPLVKSMLEEAGYEVALSGTLPDERSIIAGKLAEWADHGDIALIVTTGGTGFSPRDVTPEATTDVCERLAPGIPEAMRQASLHVTPRGMLSRSVCGIRGRTLIMNLPGSPKAIRENLEAVLPAIGHGLDMLCGGPADCAAPDAAAL
ncbi:MAG: molybdenum cofactor biosynthesis protein [Clostridiales Family XIII bacterium]|jgi:molybdenum cofactor synthesis domain-containing protein|nr:molybdenum cofactor biosynthesis protein [Clostridiales Family XIII bacterium]